MSRESLTRRRFLTLPLVLLLAPCARAMGEGSARRTSYEAEASILYGALRYRLAGSIDERVDRGAGRYELRVEGQGTSFTNHAESTGVLRDGRWTPVQSASWVKISGREGRTDVAYDYERRRVQYRSRSETFFLGRVRLVDDIVALPPGEHVDDTMSAVLNHADGYWQPGADGTLRTRVVRRKRDPREATEEASATHRAELIPVTLKLDGAEPGGTRTASFDMTHFSTWAVAGRPAKIVFGPDGRPKEVTSRLKFGTSLTVRFQPA